MRSTQLLQQEIEKYKAIQEYIAYQAQQKNFTFPEVAISIESNNDRVEVYMDVRFNDTDFHFESTKFEDAQIIYDNLNSQAVVRAKLGDGNTRTMEQTEAYVERLSNRFALDANGEPVDPNAHLYSGFTVSDAESNYFLGWTNLTPTSVAKNYAEMARLNRSEVWGHISQDVIKEYELETNQQSFKTYTGVGTAETCTMVQYAHHLKNNGYKINGQDLAAIVATARVDNPGSWKSNAKAGFEVCDVDANLEYGPELRYQLKRVVL